MIELTIPEATPALNRMFGLHWTKRTESRSRWLALVRSAKKRAGVAENPPMQKARVTVVRHARRLAVKENLIGGTHILTDSLVREGIIASDSPEHIELVVVQQVSKAPLTVVTIEPVFEHQA